MMSIKGVNIILILILLTVSCSVETPFISPFPQIIDNSASASEQNFMEKINVDLDKTYYTSELSNIISEVPKFEDKRLNLAVSELRNSVYRYLYANREANAPARKRAFEDYQENYKQTQKLKIAALKASSDEEELLNRFLTRIKTNMYLLEQNLSGSKQP